MGKRIFHSNLRLEISEKYVGNTVVELRKKIRQHGIECSYREFNFASRDQLILSLERGRWASKEEVEAEIAGISTDPAQQAPSRKDVDEGKLETSEDAPPTLKRITFDNAPELMTPRQVQELLQISRPTFFRMVQKGRLSGAFKLGNLWRVDRNKLKAWIDSQTQS